MAKRFTDTDKWKMAWFRKLGSEGRDLWNYLHDNCDCAGFFEIDLERISFELGFSVTLDRIISVLNGKVLFAAEDRIFLPAFIEFQYGSLSEACKPHLAVIKKLKNQRVWEQYSKGFQTLEEKEKEKDKEEDKEQEKEKENTRTALEKSAIEDCVSIWGQTLRRFEIRKDARLDEVGIARLIQLRGADKTKLALLGAGFEQKTESFDPGSNVSIERLLKPHIFEKLVNLGAKHQPQERKYSEYKIGGGK